MVPIKRGCVGCRKRGHKPCQHFEGPHWFCHSCGFTALLHKKSPSFLVMEGGKGESDDVWSAWLNGEDSNV